jgi:hypothetical protein
MHRGWEGRWVYGSHEMVLYFAKYLSKHDSLVQYLAVIGTRFGWGAGPNEFDVNKKFDEYEPKKTDYRRVLKTIFVGGKGEVRTTI